jgi:alcohol dehydrogenase class IV
MLELKSKVLKLKFNDKVCEVKHPTVKEHMAFSKEHEKAKDDVEKSIDCIFDFLVSLGLDKELKDALQMEHLNMILEEIGGGAKK